MIEKKDNLVVPKTGTTNYKNNSIVAKMATTRYESNFGVAILDTPNYKHGFSVGVLRRRDIKIISLSVKHRQRNGSVERKANLKEE
jgi:hypothetical protein